MPGARDLAHCVVDVRSERLPAGVAVEERREDVQGERGGAEQRIARERRDDYLADLTRGRVVLRDLLVVLRPRGLMPGGDAAVGPFGRVENRASIAHLLRCEDVRDL